MNIKRITTKIISIILIVSLISVSGCTSSKAKESFTPRLDTKSSRTLNIMGVFGNFEALDQVMNDFNAYYPNIDFSYEQVSSENMKKYIDANPDVDIFMTSKQILSGNSEELISYCTDLSKEDINFEAIEEEMLDAYYVDGKLTSVPMGQNIYGLIVNETLLKNEGLKIPETFDEFTSVLKSLKEKGYTPIQAPNDKVLAELGNSMFYDMLLSDSSFYEAVLSGNAAAKEKLNLVFDRLGVILENGYTDVTVNENYPADNYDLAILKFFEGDVPFWVCNVEKVSGMKKRESKSEAFKNNPFDYTYIYAPMGDSGAYVYREPWYGFSVYKDSDDYDYAVEFMRFLVLKDEINKIADIKGIPSVAKEKTDNAIYNKINNPSKAEMEYINNGIINQKVENVWYGTVNSYIKGEVTKDEAVQLFLTKISE